MQHQRPRPPAKRASSLRTAQANSAAAKVSSANKDGSAAKSPARLRGKLSETNLSMSKPPDSPPISSYDFPTASVAGQDDREQEPSGGRVEVSDGEPMRVKARQQELSINTSNGDASRALPGPLPFPSTSTSALDDGSLSRARTSFNSSEAHAPTVDGEQTGVNGPLPDLEELSEKTPEELMRLVVEHQQKLREQQQQIAQLSVDGAGLSRKHDTIRARHSSLLSQPSTSSFSLSSPSKHSRLSSGSSVSAELRDRPPLSPAQGSWRTSIGGSSSLSAAPATPSRGQRETTPDWELSSTRRTIPPSPSTPSRRSHTARLSSASSASVSSLFAPSPRINTRSAITHEIEKLNQENYTLRSELSGLTEHQQEKEMEWKRVIRKMERDAQSLAKELQRVGERNAALEEDLGLGLSSSVGSGPSRRWQDESGDSTPRTRTFPSLRRSPSSSFSEHEDASQSIQDFAPPAQLPTEPTRIDPDTPTNVAAARHRRSPGNGTPRALVESPTSGSGPSTPSSDLRRPILLSKVRDNDSEQEVERLRDQEQHDNVQRLLDTIDELRQTKEEIEEERIMMAERLEHATREVEMFRMKCEELEEAHGESIAWEDRKGIEWPCPSPSTTSPDFRRSKGNRRDIERAQRRYSREGSMPLSVSDHSIISTSSSIRSISPSPGGRRARGQGAGGVRTLGSELGNHWADDSFEQELDTGGDEGDVDEEDEEGSKTTGSTSTPAKHRYRPRNQRDSTISISPASIRRSYRRPFADYDLDTTQDLFPPGSLRHSGPPDQETYEALTRVASELPAVWEDEDDFNLGVAAGSPMKGEKGKGREVRRSRGVHSGRLSSGVMKGLEWREPPSKGEEEYYGRWDEKKEGAEGMRAIESGEMVDARERGLRKRKGRRRGGGLGLQLDDGDSDSDREGTALSRRQLALRRLGLEASPTSSSATLLASESRPLRQHFHYHRYHHSRTSSHSSYTSSSFSSHSSGSDLDSDVDPPSSEFSHLSSSARLARRGNNYYPLTLRARYAPTMLANRFRDNAVQKVLDLAAYIRFFAVLGMALAFALWQGPKKTMGTKPRRRIS